jgi:hypothetical protein
LQELISGLQLTGTYQFSLERDGNAIPLRFYHLDQSGKPSDEKDLDENTREKLEVALDNFVLRNAFFVRNKNHTFRTWLNTLYMVTPNFRSDFELPKGYLESITVVSLPPSHGPNFDFRTGFRSAASAKSSVTFNEDIWTTSGTTNTQEQGSNDSIPPDSRTLSG